MSRVGDAPSSSSLMVLIQESRHWASVNRGLELFVRARHVLQTSFGVDSGYFVYQKTGLWQGVADEHFRIYTPWGVMAGQEEVLQEQADVQLASSPEPLQHVSGRWMGLGEAPPAVRQNWESWGVKSGGSWLLTLGPKPVGMMVLRRTEAAEGDDSDLMGMVAGQVSLVMELLRFRRAAEEAGWRDGLTGIYNRRGVDRQMQLMVQGNPGPSGTAWVFGIFDVNRFKFINDEHGHPEGDRVLAQVAKALSAGLRPHDVCGRWGGDEFVVMVNASESQAPAVIARLQNIVSAQVPHVSVSAGWAVWGVDGEDLEGLYAVADRRLYEDKKRH